MAAALAAIVAPPAFAEDAPQTAPVIVIGATPTGGELSLKTTPAPVQTATGGAEAAVRVVSDLGSIARRCDSDREDAMSEDLLQQLLDYKAILELKARFVHTVDAKDWDGFRAVFTPSQGVFDFGGGFTVEGGDAFVTAVAGQLEGARSVHRAFLPQISFQSPTEAKGEWAVNDYIEWTPDPVTGERRGHQGFGYEYESYRKVDGAWKISAWRVHYVRMDPVPRAPLPDSYLGGPDVLRDAAYLAAVTRPPY